MPDVRAELERLLTKQQRAQQRVEDVESEAREAHAVAQATQQALIEFERKGGRASEREQLEAALAEAKSTATEPWPERVTGARHALDDAVKAVRAYEAEHLDMLLSDLADEGRRACDAIDGGARMVLDGYALRADVEQRTFALINTVRPARSGDVERTRAEQLAGEARKLLDNGGEASPRVLHDPRQPRHNAEVVEPAVA